ncbi:MAG: SAM-dependent DNA methyltransferase [Oscillibacter sp.]|nr:SAM-dependent DNA methyltransferase [Oscillibacter sp.]
MESIRKLEAELWEAADLLRAGSKLTSNQYCMPVLGLIFLRYAYSRFRMVEQEILKNRPVYHGRPIPVEKRDFIAKSALYLPKEAQYGYLLNLPANIKEAHIADRTGREIASLGEAVNNAMELTEEQSPKLTGILPKDYAQFDDGLLSELLKIFNNSALDDVGGDIIGRIYEYFLNKFAKNVASDDGVFFTPKSLVKMIVNVLEPRRGILLDPACGSGGMFVQTGDFVNRQGMSANNAMTFYGQEKVDYNSRLCLMNMAVHGLSGNIVSGDDANTFYHDAHHLSGRCDYVMANPPFNVDKVKAESAQSAGRLPFGLPGVNKKSKEVGNANYLWISYFYAYLNERGRAGFVMASSATDSQGRDKEIRRQLVETGHVDVMVSAGNNFFYTKSLPCSLWFFDKGKPEALQDKVLFIDARNYYTAVDRTLNEWTEQQLQNLNAIVWLYRGETEKYRNLIRTYQGAIRAAIDGLRETEEAAAFRKATGDALEGVAPRYGADAPEACLDALNETLSAAKRAAETAIAEKRGRKKAVNAAHSAFESAVRDIQRVIREYVWLTEKFGKSGDYRDIPGLCRIATREEIAEKGYSLTPGAYVGVAPTEDDGVQFASRMGEIHRELLTLQEESGKLMDVISRNMKEMGL